MQFIDSEYYLKAMSQIILYNFKVEQYQNIVNDNKIYGEDSQIAMLLWTNFFEFIFNKVCF